MKAYDKFITLPNQETVVKKDEQAQAMRVMYADCNICDLVITEPILVDQHTKHVKNVEAQERVAARMDSHKRMHKIVAKANVIRKMVPSYN